MLASCGKVVARSHVRIATLNRTYACVHRYGIKISFSFWRTCTRQAQGQAGRKGRFNCTRRPRKPSFHCEVFRFSPSSRRATSGRRLSEGFPRWPCNEDEESHLVGFVAVALGCGRGCRGRWKEHMLLSFLLSASSAAQVLERKAGGAGFFTVEAIQVAFYPAAAATATRKCAPREDIVAKGDRLRRCSIEWPRIYTMAASSQNDCCDNVGARAQEFLDKVPPCTSDESDHGIGLCGWLLTMISWGLVMVTLPFSLFVCFKVVQEYERAVIFRLGRLLAGGSRGPGLFFVLPCIENYQKVDLRTITLDVPPQEVLTRDSVTVSVDAVVYYRVSNATVSVANVENAHHSTRLLAQTTLRNILGTKNLHEILSDRESISGSMQTVLDDATTAWGIKVERVEIKDARLPVQLQRAMAAEAEAAREARAKVIAAEGEQKASRALKEASDVISETSSALQLRYLQTLNSISAEKNSTIIFPLPIDLISSFLGTSSGNGRSEKDD